MEELLVLGLIPGTSIQIHFTLLTWLLWFVIGFLSVRFIQRKQLIFIVLTVALITLHIRRARA